MPLSNTIGLRWRHRENTISFAIAACSTALWRGRATHSYGEEDIVVLAVALMAGISLAHAFEQGNKRTAFEAMWHFLRLNGYDLAIEDTETWADAVISLIEHRSTEEDFAQALRPVVVPRP
jgi:prophage maintenance system killer protein